YFSVIEGAQLFVLADGAQPVPDGARLAAEAMSPYPPTGCPSDAPADEAELRCAVERANAKIVEAAAGSTSIAAVAMPHHEAPVAVAGDASVLGIGELARAPANVPLGTPSLAPIRVHRIALSSADTIAIVDRGLLDAVGPAAIQHALPRGHDNIADVEHAV